MDTLPDIRCASCGRLDVSRNYNKFEKESEKSKDFILIELRDRFNIRNKGESLLTIAYQYLFNDKDKMPQVIIDSIRKNKMSEELGDLTDIDDIEYQLKSLFPNEYQSIIFKMKRGMSYFDSVKKTFTNNKNNLDRAIKFGEISLDNINWKYYKPIFESFVKSNNYNDVDIDADPYVLMKDKRLEKWFKDFAPSIDDRLYKGYTFDAYINELSSNYKEYILNTLNVKNSCCRANMLNNMLIPMAKELTITKKIEDRDYNLNKFNYIVNEMKNIGINPSYISSKYNHNDSSKWYGKILNKILEKDDRFKDDNGWIGTLLEYGFPLKQALGTELMRDKSDIDVPIEEFVKSLLRYFNAFNIGLKYNIEITKMNKLVRNYEPYLKGQMELDFENENFKAFTSIQNPEIILEELKELEVDSLKNLTFLGFIYKNLSDNEKNDFEKFLIGLMPDEESKDSLKRMGIDDLLINQSYNLSKLDDLLKIIVLPIDYVIFLLNDNWTVEQVITKLNLMNLDFSTLDLQDDEFYKIVKEMMSVIEYVGRYVNVDIIVKKQREKVKIGEMEIGGIIDEKLEDYKKLASNVIKIVNSAKDLEVILKDRIISNLPDSYLDILEKISKIPINKLNDKNHIDFLNVLKLGYTYSNKFYIKYYLPEDENHRKENTVVDEKDNYIIDKSFSKPPTKFEINRTRIYVNGFRVNKLNKNEKVVNGVLLRNGKPILPDTFEYKNTVNSEFIDKFDQLGYFKEDDEEMQIDNLIGEINSNKDNFSSSMNMNAEEIEDSMVYF